MAAVREGLAVVVVLLFCEAEQHKGNVVIWRGRGVVYLVL